VLGTGFWWDTPRCIGVDDDTLLCQLVAYPNVVPRRAASPQKLRPAAEWLLPFSTELDGGLGWLTTAATGVRVVLALVQTAAVMVAAAGATRPAKTTLEGENFHTITPQVVSTASTSHGACVTYLVSAAVAPSVLPLSDL